MRYPSSCVAHCNGLFFTSLSHFGLIKTCSGRDRHPSARWPCHCILRQATRPIHQRSRPRTGRVDHRPALGLHGRCDDHLLRQGNNREPGPGARPIAQQALAGATDSPCLVLVVGSISCVSIGFAVHLSVFVAVHLVVGRAPRSSLPPSIDLDGRIHASGRTGPLEKVLNSPTCSLFVDLCLVLFVFCSQVDFNLRATTQPEVHGRPEPHTDWQDPRRCSELAAGHRPRRQRSPRRGRSCPHC